MIDIKPQEMARLINSSYVNFKLKSHAKAIGFDFKQEEAKQKLAKIARPLLAGWILEAQAAGY